MSELKTPEFLLCELPIKDGSLDSKRLFVYVPSALSLIEVVPWDSFEPILTEETIYADFEYENSLGHLEKYTLYFSQNNCGYIGFEESAILKNVWAWFVEYLQWEDHNIDGESKAKHN